VTGRCAPPQGPVYLTLPREVLAADLHELVLRQDALAVPSEPARLPRYVAPAACAASSTSGKPKRSKKAAPKPAARVRVPKVKIPKGQGSLF
jgi:hypothetical protein